MINFANSAFRESQRRNRKTGIEVGRFDKVVSYGPRNIDRIFYRKNKEILSQDCGAGYWLWKPYLVVKSLSHLDDGDFLFYCDSGSYFIEPIQPLIDICQETRQDVIPFELQLVEKDWTKRDAFILMACDTPEYTDSRQRLASFSLWKKSAFSVDFANQLLFYAQDVRILTNLENQMGYPNYPGFREHRHDQSVFSLLTKKHHLRAYRDPSQWGNEESHEYPDSKYGQLICSTRE